MRAPTTGNASSQGGNRSSRANFTYGKLETIASASSTTPATFTPPDAVGAAIVANARTAAAAVVGTPLKNRPFLGETLNRARRIAAHTATNAQAGISSALGAVPDNQV